MSHEYIQHDESQKHAEFKEAKPRSVCGQRMRHLPGMHEGLGLISSTGKKVWKEWEWELPKEAMEMFFTRTVTALRGAFLFNVD